MEIFYTSKQVADILGINESSVKRWSNSGTLKCFKTPGGHRKFKKKDVIDFAVRFSYDIPENIFSIVEGSSRSDFEFEKIKNILLRKLLYGTEEDIFDYLNSLLLNGMNITDLFDSVISKVMEKIGEMWEGDEIGVEVEHIATGRLSKALILLQPKIESIRKNGLTAFCGGLEGELHEFPLLSLSVLLKSMGWKVINAGANLPLDSFVQGVRKYLPDLVCLSATVVENPDVFSKNTKSLYDTVKEIDSKLVVGGSGVLNNSKSIFFDFHAENFKSVSQYIKKNFLP